MNCVLKYQGKILIVQRSKGLNFYPEYWNGISGFLDDAKSLKQKIQEELKEELGIAKSKIAKIQLGEIFDQEESKYGKTWIVHPVLVEVTTRAMFNALVLTWTYDFNLLPYYVCHLKESLKI